MWRRSKVRPEGAEQSTGQQEAEPVPGLMRRLQWTIIRPLATALGGDERSLARGSGMELTEVREYQPGDDVRHIDWNITARSDRPFVREAYVERAVDVWLLVDVSASVDWGTAETLKRSRAMEFAAVASNLIIRHGNRVGAMTFAERPLGFVPPAAGRSHLLRLLAGIREEPRQKHLGATDLRAALERLGSIARHRSVVIVISDFLVAEGWQPALAKLAARHEVIAVVVGDPREQALPDIGLVTFEDPETAAQLVVNTGDPRLRERFRQAAAAQREQLGLELSRLGVEHLALSTGAPLLQPLVDFLKARQARRRVARPVA